MWKSDVDCPECGAGYHRVVITSCEGEAGEYRCLTCDHVLEVFDGSFAVLIRLTVRPEKNASMYACGIATPRGQAKWSATQVQRVLEALPKIGY